MSVEMCVKTWLAPTPADSERLAELDRLIRCFDRNGGRSFDLPRTDPHGRPWSSLSTEQLRDVAGWCMLPEYHEALMRERTRRTFDTLDALMTADNPAMPS